MSSIFPCIAITGAVWGSQEQKNQKKSLDEIALGGTLAEEVISTVRTAQAFGAQSKLAALYDKHIIKAQGFDMKISAYVGVGVAASTFLLRTAASTHMHTDLLLCHLCGLRCGFD